MLVKNAENLMQAVIKTVQAAESACMKVNAASSLSVWATEWTFESSSFRTSDMDQCGYCWFQEGKKQTLRYPQFSMEATCICEAY